MTRIVYAGVRRRFEPGRASKYISPLNLQPGDKVVLWCRVSKESNRAHLHDQEAALRRAVAACGAVVVDVRRWVCKGFDLGRVAAAATLAREHGATLLGETADRFLRSRAYSNTNQTPQPTDHEFKELAFCTGGVRLMTLQHPDATPGEMRGCQTRRGQGEGGNRGGRPTKTPPGGKRRRRLYLTPLVLKLHCRGLSGRQISEWTDLPESTVRRWRAET